MKKINLRDTVTASSIIGIIMAYIFIVAINNVLYESAITSRFMIKTMAYGAPFVFLAGFFNQYLVRWCNTKSWCLRHEHWTSLLQLLFAIIIAFLFTVFAFVMFEPIEHPSDVSGILSRPNVHISIVADAMMNCFIMVLAKYTDQMSVARNQEQRIREVEAEIIHVKYQQLKAQVNPHFLFNALNSLSSLINSNPAKASDFTRQLASIYRYLLSNDRQDVVFLSDEFKFAQQYSNILHIRHGDALHINMPALTDPAVLSMRIIPTSLQILIENACKHNIVSASHPLTINVVIDNNNLVVTNNVKPRPTPADSTGLGLSGLREKYHIILGRDISIQSSDSQFSVSVPLLRRTDLKNNDLNNNDLNNNQ